VLHPKTHLATLTVCIGNALIVLQVIFKKAAAHKYIVCGCDVCAVQRTAVNIQGIVSIRITGLSCQRFEAASYILLLLLYPLAFKTTGSHSVAYQKFIG